MFRTNAAKLVSLKKHFLVKNEKSDFTHVRRKGNFSPDLRRPWIGRRISVAGNGDMKIGITGSVGKDRNLKN